MRFPAQAHPAAGRDDALSIVVGSVQEGDDVQVMATWRVGVEGLAGLRGAVRRPRVRRSVHEAVVDHVAAIRAAVQAD